MKQLPKCPVSEVCGGCQLQHLSYDKQLQLKQQRVEKALGCFAPVEKIDGMEWPYNYRNKVQISYGLDDRKRIIAGNYVTSTHTIVPVSECQLASETANAIFKTITALVKSFKLSVFDENAMQGFLRHVLVRTSCDSEEVMVVLVTGSPVFPKKNDFIKALCSKHKNIVTVVQNINRRHTSMILGDRNIVLFGKGYIHDELCGYEFLVSPQSFYQVNHSQTEKLYNHAITMADLKGEERVLDAYCGVGTIGIIASSKAFHVDGVEINNQAIKDAVKNARMNEVKNISFYCADAGRFMREKAAKKEKYDVVIMDPPRSGSDTAFLSSVVKLAPEKVVYISCNYLTQKRDLSYLTKHGYKVDKIQPVDMFPMTEHVESIALLKRKNDGRFSI